MKPTLYKSHLSGMLLLKILSAGIPILLIEYLRRIDEFELIGRYQSMISSVEVVISILLIGTGQYFIKTKPTDKIVHKVLHKIILSTLIFSFLTFKPSWNSILLISSSLILRFYSSVFLSRKKYFQASLLNNNLLIIFFLLSLAVLNFEWFKKLTSNILTFSSWPKLFIGSVIMFSISLKTLQETYSYYLPRVFNILRSNIDILIIPLYIDATTFGTYVFLTRWSRLISFPLTVFINYLSPKYVEYREEKNKFLILLGTYYKALIPYTILSGTGLYIYLNQIETTESILIFLAILIPTINLLFGPIGIPINLGKDKSRNHLTLYNGFDSILYLLIVANLVSDLKELLLLELIRVIIFNSFKYFYTRKYEW